MNKSLTPWSYLTILGFICLLLIASCSKPSSPDFSFEHSIDLPLVDVQYRFLGGTGAIIDTTSGSTPDIYSTDDDGMVKIATEFDFNAGNFSNIIPEVTGAPVGMDTEIGLLEISFDGTGTADFESITGIHPNNQPASNETITAGFAPNVSVELQVDDFDEGTLESGRIRVAFENGLGFHIQSINARLVSEGTQVGDNINLSNISHGSNDIGFITFEDGDRLSIPLSIVFDIDWETQNMSSNAGRLDINISDDDLVFNEARAVIKSQHFGSEGSISISEEGIRLTSPQHFVQLENGTLSVRDMVNGIDLDLNPVYITFPRVIFPPYRSQDSLVVRFEGQEMVPANAFNIADREVDLSNARIYAPNNEVTYRVHGISEDTGDAPSGNRKRTIHSEDSFTGNIELLDLLVAESYGVLTPKVVALSEDEDEDGKLDLFNDEEASITTIDDFDSLSEMLSNVRFYNPELVLHYHTSVLTDNSIFAAIVGINADGEKVYLKAADNSEFVVSSSDTIRGFYNDGTEVSHHDLVRIEIEPHNIGSDWTASGTVVFDTDNSNVSDFLSALPTEIRFVGKSLVNPDSEVGRVNDPIFFETNMSIDLPMNIGTEDAATYSDVLDADLSDLPDENSDMKVGEAILRLDYVNDLPLSIELKLEFLDANDNVLTQVPLQQGGEQDILLHSAPIDPVTRFSMGPIEDHTLIVLNEDQLDFLNEAKSIRLQGNLETMVTDGSKEVRVRGEDSLAFRIFGKFKLITKVD